MVGAATVTAGVGDPLAAMGPTEAGRMVANTVLSTDDDIAGMIGMLAGITPIATTKDEFPRPHTCCSQQQSGE